MGVYRIENVVTGKSYVGSSNCIHIRWKFHIVELSSGTHPNPSLQASVTQHGLHSLRFSILEEVASEDDLFTREHHWFHALTPELYNIEMPNPHKIRKTALYSPPKQ